MTHIVLDLLYRQTMSERKWSAAAQALGRMEAEGLIEWSCAGHLAIGPCGRKRIDTLPRSRHFPNQQLTAFLYVWFRKSRTWWKCCGDKSKDRQLMEQVRQVVHPDSSSEIDPKEVKVAVVNARWKAEWERQKARLSNQLAGAPLLYCDSVHLPSSSILVELQVHSGTAFFDDLLEAGLVRV